MPEVEEDGDVRENLVAGKVLRELAASHRGPSGEMAADNAKQKLTSSYPMVLISAYTSSTMNALGRHSGLALIAFLFNSVIQREVNLFTSFGYDESYRYSIMPLVEYQHRI
jgi:hypothetical protein